MNVGRLCLLGILALVAGCGAEAPKPGTVETATSAAIDPPAAPGSFAPELWADDAGLLMTWLEPLGAERSDGHRVRFSRLEGDAWSEPVTVVEGLDLFANWADFPSPARAADGTIYVHWLAKTAEETYAYSIYLARSTDGGRSWAPVGTLNDDATHTEHGFVSWVAEGEALRAFWLDGREMADGGPMTLRTARLETAGDAPVGRAEMLDARVCECCPTDATVTASGAVAVYRDRSEGEVRDVYAVRQLAEGWSNPAAVAADGWNIEGCPVNGPALAASGDAVASAWFTAAADGPRVRAALSTDGGASFGEPHLIDGDGTLGRVDVAMVDRERAAVVWYDVEGGRAALRLKSLGPAGPSSESLLVGTTSLARASGFPRMARVEDVLVVAWTEIDGEDPSRLRVRSVPLGSLP